MIKRIMGIILVFWSSSQAGLPDFLGDRTLNATFIEQVVDQALLLANNGQEREFDIRSVSKNAVQKVFHITLFTDFLTRKNYYRSFSTQKNNKSVKKLIEEGAISLDNLEGTTYKISLQNYSNRTPFTLSITEISTTKPVQVAPNSMGISIIIPTYNRITDCLACVCHLKARIRAPKDQWEVIVVADGCTDGTGAHLQALFMQKGFENFRVIWTPKEPGKYRNGGWARNAGAKAARLSHLTFCDTDIYHLTDPVTPSLKELRQGCTDLIVGYMYFLMPDYAAFPPENFELMVHPNIDKSEACWMVISKESFISIGGNSEKLEKWGYEDTDLLGRLTKAGFKRKRLPSIVSTLAHEYNEDHKPDQIKLVEDNKEILNKDTSLVRNKDKPDWGRFTEQPVFPERTPDFSKVN